MIDHRLNMRPASFRGVRFEVDTDTREGYGRHVVVHEYVKGEQHATEDLGRKVGRIKFTAYIAGDDAYARRDALISACTAPGPGTLILPTGTARQVNCIAATTNDERLKLGYVGVDLEFVEKGAQIGPIGVSIGNRVLASLLTGLGAAISAAVSGRADWSIANPGVVAETAANAVALVETVRAAVVTDAEASADLFARLQDLNARVAPDLANAERVSVWLAEMVEVADDIAENSEPDLRAVEWRAALSDATVLVPASKSPVLSNALAPSARGAVAVECLALCEYARAVADRTYLDRQSALEARTMLREESEPALVRIGRSLGEECYFIAARAVSLACDHLAETALTLKPIVVVDTHKVIPSTLAAWAIYADPSRAQDLVHRNAVSTPLIMPRQFEALAE